MPICCCPTAIFYIFCHAVLAHMLSQFNHKIDCQQQSVYLLKCHSNRPISFMCTQYHTMRRNITRLLRHGKGKAVKQRAKDSFMGKNYFVVIRVCFMNLALYACCIIAKGQHASYFITVSLLPYRAVFANH